MMYNEKMWVWLLMKKNGNGFVKWQYSAAESELFVSYSSYSVSVFHKPLYSLANDCPEHI